MIEKEKDLFCAQQHKQPILIVVLDPTLQVHQRLLCAECVKDYKANVATMGFELAQKQIQENHNKKLEARNKIIEFNKKNILKFKRNFEELKSQIQAQMNDIIRYTDFWIQKLQEMGRDHFSYSFHEELEKIINNSLSNTTDKIILLDEIKTVNDYYKLEISNKFENLRCLKQYQKCKDILICLNQTIEVKEEEIQSSKQLQQQFQQQLQQQFEQQQDLTNVQKHKSDLEGQIQISQKDGSIKQLSKCYAMAFNKSGSQMVSMSNFDIKVWIINDGKLNLESTLQAHSSFIYCFVYSKLQECFISGSNDKTIICWKKKNDKDWKKSPQYDQHQGWVGSMILNRNETQLFSGGGDQQIFVWQVNLSQNLLQYQYSLVKHTNSIRSMSLNDSENTIISCGDDQQIIIWEIGTNKQFQFKQVFTQFLNSSGCHLKFLNDNRFIWLPFNKELNFICMFQQKNGIFYEVPDNRIQLISNSKQFGCSLFPIVYLKDKNVIFIRSKNTIYMLREINQKFHIVNQINCNTNWNFGAATNDGKYLVIWDDHKKRYQLIELQYK